MDLITRRRPAHTSLLGHAQGQTAWPWTQETLFSNAQADGTSEHAKLDPFPFIILSCKHNFSSLSSSHHKHQLRTPPPSLCAAPDTKRQAENRRSSHSQASLTFPRQPVAPNFRDSHGPCAHSLHPLYSGMRLSRGSQHGAVSMVIAAEPERVLEQMLHDPQSQVHVCFQPLLWLCCLKVESVLLLPTTLLQALRLHLELGGLLQL